MPYPGIPDNLIPKMEKCVMEVMKDGKTKEQAIKICRSKIMPKATNDNQTFKGKFESATDLGTLMAANDGNLPEEIPVLPKGEFMTMPYGNMVLDDKCFDDMIANFERKVRRATPVDVDHSMNGESRAAGWIKKLLNKADGLWASVKWNKLGKELAGAELYKMIRSEGS